MTDNLIERLNALAIDCENTDGWEEAAATCDEAAQALKAKDAALAAKDAEIERLREALTELVDSLDAVDAEAVRAEKAGEPGWSSAPAVRSLYARETARKALGGSDE